jgi:hypothetical protein
MALAGKDHANVFRKIEVNAATVKVFLNKSSRRRTGFRSGTWLPTATAEAGTFGRGGGDGRCTD